LGHNDLGFIKHLGRVETPGTASGNQLPRNIIRDFKSLARGDRPQFSKYELSVCNDLHVKWS
jgi:hypothetical protein